MTRKLKFFNFGVVKLRFLYDTRPSEVNILLKGFLGLELQNVIMRLHSDQLIVIISV